MDANEVYNETDSAEAKTENHHISFKECFSDGWREYFQKEDVLLKIIEAAGLSDTHELVQINSGHFIDDHGMAIIILLKRRSNSTLDKAIIDVIASHPRFEQFINVFYELGADCDYRIIVYDNNGNCQDVDSPCLSSFSRMPTLIEYLNGCAFICAMGINMEKSESNTVSLEFTDIESNGEGPDQFTDTDSNGDGQDRHEVPDRGDLEELFFWEQYFYPAYTGTTCPYYSCNSGPFDYSGDDISLTADWTDKGMIIECDIDSDAFTWLFTKERERLEDMWNCSIQYDEGDGTITVNRNKNKSYKLIALHEESNLSIEGNKITITREIPFRNFIHSPNSEREGWTDEFVSDIGSLTALDYILSERDESEDY